VPESFGNPKPISPNLPGYVRVFHGGTSSSLPDFTLFFNRRPFPHFKRSFCRLAGDWVSSHPLSVLTTEANSRVCRSLSVRPRLSLVLADAPPPSVPRRRETTRPPFLCFRSNQETPTPFGSLRPEIGFHAPPLRVTRSRNFSSLGFPFTTGLGRGPRSCHFGRKFPFITSFLTPGGDRRRLQLFRFYATPWSRYSLSPYAPASPLHSLRFSCLLRQLPVGWPVLRRFPLSVHPWRRRLCFFATQARTWPSFQPFRRHGIDRSLEKGDFFFTPSRLYALGLDSSIASASPGPRLTCTPAPGSRQCATFFFLDFLRDYSPRTQIGSSALLCVLFPPPPSKQGKRSDAWTFKRYEIGGLIFLLLICPPYT